MTLLEQEGFLRTVPRRGVFIVRKTKKQIIEMIEMWAALESMAARLATLNASDEDIAALRTMFDEFRNSTPAEHIHEYSDANIAFHQAIIRLSGSHLMGKTIENLFIHVRAIRRHDDLAERPRGALDRRPHAHHRGAGEARHRARRAPRAPALARPRRARREALRFSANEPGLMTRCRGASSTRRGCAASGGGATRRPKGRAVDPQALADVQALLGDAPRERDLLIEHLHRIQDRFGCLSAAHLVALAQEMKLAMTEVYEVATFYHHFDVVKDGEAPPPPITVRVCETLSCEMAGARRAARRCRLLGAGRARAAAPCIGRCEQAPAAVVGRNPVDARDGREVARWRSRARRHASQRSGSYAATSTTRRTARQGGYRRSRDCIDGERTSKRDRRDGRLGLARPRRRRLPGRPQVEDRARPSPRRA